MFTRATLPPWTATPTIAQSIARLVNFWNDRCFGREYALFCALDEIRVARIDSHHIVQYDCRE